MCDLHSCTVTNIHTWELPRTTASLGLLDQLAASLEQLGMLKLAQGHFDSCHRGQRERATLISGPGSVRM